MALALCGCTSVQVADRGESRVYLGVVRVTVPDRAGDLVAYSVKTAGAGWHRGPWLGWRSDTWVEADPAKCQLLVVIRSGVEARNAAEVLRALEGRNACVADYTGSLRH
ncbi:hypothetical protein PX554_04375 [Sphingomonas sp. H39-1-10]|uniref:hypothetical protein n=1 Tax=Sphingomonas sp. NFR15 TaxID=1566282 RepID=UPI000B8986B2|nr:hypothetical protein [Sphingomonas sp. NFR15]MDF0487355.1 hypothetical protein [Sphingomonas pollutisoli]